jgi:hypothetical protein
VGQRGNCAHAQKKELPKILRQMHRILKEDSILYISVREGDAEGFVADSSGAKHFFANWKGDELLAHTNPYFALVEDYARFIPEEEFPWLYFILKKNNCNLAKPYKLPCEENTLWISLLSLAEKTLISSTLRDSGLSRLLHYAEARNDIWLLVDLNTTRQKLFSLKRSGTKI